MCKKLIFLISFVAVLGLAGNASAATIWWVGSKPQVDKFTPANVEVGDIFTLTATGDGNTADVSYTAGAATVADVTVGLTAAWNNDSNYLCTPITAANDITNSFLTLTADVAAVTFSVAASTTNGGAVDDQTLTRVGVTTSNNDWGNQFNWSRAEDGAPFLPNPMNPARLDLTEYDPCAPITTDTNSWPGPTVNAGTWIQALMGPAYWCNADGLGEQTLTINSGTLKVSKHVQIAQWGTKNGPSTNSGRIVVNPSATFNVLGNLSVGNWGRGIVDVNGGTINITGELQVPSKAAEYTGEGTVNLTSGTLSCGFLGMYPLPMSPNTTGLIDIETGTLIIEGNDVVSTVEDYVIAGRITSYGGGGIVNIQYTGGNTEVTASIATPAEKYARFPSPIGAVTLFKTANDQVILTWLSGDDANTVFGQDVYFGTDWDDVNEADSTDITGIYLGRQTANSIDVTALVELIDPVAFDPNYFWRVDAVNGFTATVWKRPLTWSIIMPDSILIDDFEDYDTTAALENSWGNFKQPGNPTWTIVTLAQTPSLDSNSMKFKIVNSIGSPGYSDTNTVFDPNEDWTAYGLKALTVSFYGTAGNVAQQLYMEVKDSFGSTKAVLYSGDANDVNEKAWHEWNVALSEFTGVDINHVAMLTIRASDATPGFDGESIYIDDVTLYPTRCIPYDEDDLVPTGPAGDFIGAPDFGGDCFVDNREIEELNKWWLDFEHNVPTFPPDANKLVLHYKLDGTFDPNVIDWAGDYNGVIDGTNYSWNLGGGHDGNSLDVNGLGGGRIRADANVWADLPGNNVTVSVWVKMEPTPPAWVGYIFWISDNFPPCMSARFWPLTGPDDGPVVAFWGTKSDSTQYWDAKTNWDFSTATQIPSETIAEMEGQWHHFAFVKDYNGVDPNTHKIYYDGELVVTTEIPWKILDGGCSSDAFYVAGSKWGLGERFEGEMDEFRIYGYALPQEEVGDLTGLLVKYYVTSKANVVDDGILNFKDYAVIANDWLEQKLFP